MMLGLGSNLYGSERVIRHLLLVGQLLELLFGLFHVFLGALHGDFVTLAFRGWELDADSAAVINDGAQKFS